MAAGKGGKTGIRSEAAPYVRLRTCERWSDDCRSGRNPVCQRVETPQLAGISRPHVLPARPRACQLGSECAPDLVDLGLLMNTFDALLRRQRDQHSKDNDTDFTGERAPAMQRFRDMEMHGTGPRAS